MTTQLAMHNLSWTSLSELQELHVEDKRAVRWDQARDLARTILHTGNGNISGSRTAIAQIVAKLSGQTTFRTPCPPPPPHNQRGTS
jgi:hypothetical protein